MKRIGTLAWALILLVGFVATAPCQAQSAPKSSQAPVAAPARANAQPTAPPAAAAVPATPAQPAASATPAAATPAPPAASVTPAPALPAAPPATSEPVWVGAVQAPVPTTAYAPATNVCVPSCRSGFVCTSGQCVSACNPLCLVNEICTGQATCERVRRPEKPGARRHDGFLLRATSLFAVSAWRADSGAESQSALTETGVAGGLALDVGAAVIDNLIVRGRLSGGWELMRDGAFARDLDAVFAFGVLGVGADYYFMPLNLYVGATLGLAGVTLIEVREEERDARSLHSKTGAAFDLDVGKEWWLTGNWGLGVGLRLRYLSVPPANIVPGSDGALTALQIGLMFTATYN